MPTVSERKEAENLRRKTAVEYMRSLATVQWMVKTPSLYRDSDCTFKLQPNRIYTGFPYCHAVGSVEKLESVTARRIGAVHVISDAIAYYDETTDTEFNVPPDTVVPGHYLGLDCSTAIAAAWRRVSPNAAFTRTSTLIPTARSCEAFGIRKLGEYDLNGEDYNTSWDENFEQNSKLTGDEIAKRDYRYRSIVSNPDGSICRDKLRKLYEAYALCREGDAVVFYCKGYLNAKKTEFNAGHVRMVCEAAHVVRDESGAIDPDESYLVTIEQGKANLNKVTMLGGSPCKYTTWGVNLKYSFCQLAGIELAFGEKKDYNVYIPITLADFDHSELPKAQIRITDTENPMEGVVSSDFGIVFTELSIDGMQDRQFTGMYGWNVALDGKTGAPFEGMDESGKTSAERITAFRSIRWEAARQLYKSVSLKKHAPAFANLPKGEHRYELTVLLTTGECKTFTGSFRT